MAKEMAAAGDKLAVAVAGPGHDDQNMAIPAGKFDMACWETGPDGKPRQVWAARAHNGVVKQGLAMLGNIGLAAQRATTNGPFMFLHNGAFNSTYAWAQISASHVGGYSASLLPVALASTDATATLWTASTNFVFSNAGTLTVNGAGFVYFSSASAATNAANSSDFKLYNIGTFTAAQNVQSNNTLSVTVSLVINTTA
jgi:hypothetical protein